jgi:hypothetical protein
MHIPLTTDYASTRTQRRLDHAHGAVRRTRTHWRVRRKRRSVMRRHPSHRPGPRLGLRFLLWGTR